jgi:SAM-dependent methyltransferase
MSELPPHVATNRTYWDDRAENYVAWGEEAWASNEVLWGVWRTPNTALPLLPEDMTGLDAIELGCGTAYGSAWMHRRGAQVTAIDNSEAQLATARRLQQKHSRSFPLIHGNAEAVPHEDGSFDFAFSEYGASIWADPHLWVPEAHRLLRPGGRLVFLGHTALSMVCSPVDGSLPVTDRLERPWFGLHRFDWTGAIDDPGGVEFALNTGDWFTLFREVGFAVDDYREVRAPVGDVGDKSWVTVDWARRFPSEQAWFVTKR